MKKELRRIMRAICTNEGMQEGVDIALGEGPKIYLNFRDTMDKPCPKHGSAPYLNSTGHTPWEVFQQVGEYGLRRDEHKPIRGPGNSVALSFQLIG